MTNVNHRSHQDILIVVAKRPAPGQTKTRLCPPLAPDQAARLYECFLLDTIELMRSLDNIQLSVAYLPANQESYFEELAPEFDRVLQVGFSLGSRLDNTLSQYLNRGYERAVIMNSDSPTLPVSCLTDAFERLSSEADVVLGPCVDGGYYLIGLKHPAPRLLREVKMSTENVTVDTLKIAREEGLTVSLLQEWYDVDDRSSLIRLLNELKDSEELARYTRAFLYHPSMQTVVGGLVNPGSI